jgi:hypothetical protein
MYENLYLNLQAKINKLYLKRNPENASELNKSQR